LVCYAVIKQMKAGRAVDRLCKRADKRKEGGFGQEDERKRSFPGGSGEMLKRTNAGKGLVGKRNKSRLGVAVGAVHPGTNGREDVKKGSKQMREKSHNMGEGQDQGTKNESGPEKERGENESFPD